MSAPESPGSLIRPQRTFYVRFLGPATAIALASLAAACMTTQPVLDTRASDPDVRVPRASYRPVLGGYVSGRPVETAPWTGKSGAAPADKERH